MDRRCDVLVNKFSTIDTLSSFLGYFKRVACPMWCRACLGGLDVVVVLKSGYRIPEIKYTKSNMQQSCCMDSTY